MIESGDGICPDLNQKVRQLFIGLDQQSIDGIIELVPSYRSLMVLYEPLKISLQQLKAQISDTANQLEPEVAARSQPLAVLIFPCWDNSNREKP